MLITLMGTIKKPFIIMKNLLNYVRLMMRPITI